MSFFAHTLAKYFSYVLFTYIVSMYYAEHSGGKKEQKTYAAAMSSISYLETWKKNSGRSKEVIVTMKELFWNEASTFHVNWKSFQFF